jgi:hypothetical protein
MAPPDGISGAGRGNLYLSASSNTQPAPGNRADVLAKKLDQRLNNRLDQIRSQMSQPAVSPNSEQTGQRLDILA